MRTIFSDRNDSFHLKVSLVKSALRIVACAFLAVGMLVTAAGFLVAAEALGIVEEF